MDLPQGSRVSGEKVLFDPAWVRLILPGIAEMVAGAMDALETADRIIACRHVLDGLGYGVGCVGHIGAGLACDRCLWHHFRRHAPESDRTCDECGAVVPIVQAFSYLLGAGRMLVVQDTRGRRRTLDGFVLLTGFGVCRPCWDRLLSGPG